MCKKFYMKEFKYNDRVCLQYLNFNCQKRRIFNIHWVRQRRWHKCRNRLLRRNESFWVLFYLSFISFFSSYLGNIDNRLSNPRLSITTQTYCCSFVIIPWFYEYSRKAECITELTAPSLSQRGTLRVQYSNKILKIHLTALSLQFFFKSTDYGRSVEIMEKVANKMMSITDHWKYILLFFLQMLYIIDF